MKFSKDDRIGQDFSDSNFLIKQGSQSIDIGIEDLAESTLATQKANEGECLFEDLISNQLAGVYRILFKKPQKDQTIWDTVEYEFVSERFCDILGIERLLSQRKSISLSLSRMHPDDIKDFIQSNEEANQLLHPFSWEGRIVVNQKVKWVRFDSKPRKLKDGSVRWTGIVIETTAQRQTEELVIKNSNRLMRLNDCLSSLGLDYEDNINRLTALCGELLFATCALYNRFENGCLYAAGKWQTPVGFIDKVAPEGHLCYDIIRNNKDEVVTISNLAASCYALTDPNVLTYHLQTYCGQVVRCEGKAVGSLCVVYTIDYQLKDEERRILGIIGSAIGNEDNRKSSREALESSELKLKELNATKDKFFSIIAHDLKSPFNGIIGFSSILKEEARNLDTSTIIDYAEMINYSAHQTHRLLENLLSWARMQQGRMSFNPIPNLLHSIVNEVISLSKEGADRKKITLVSEVPLQLIVKADTEMLKTILRNLISNALKFTRTNGKVTVVAELCESAVLVVVEDNGEGIRAEDMTKLFNVGIAFSTRGTENEKGTGLGLILCKEFVEKHKGVLSAESQPGRGSKFKFTLPLV